MVRIEETLEFDGKLLGKDSDGQLYVINPTTCTMRKIVEENKVVGQANSAKCLDSPGGILTE